MNSLSRSMTLGGHVRTQGVLKARQQVAISLDIS